MYERVDKTASQVVIVRPILIRLPEQDVAQQILLPQ